MNEFIILPICVEKCLKKCIDEKFEQYDLKSRFNDMLIRESVFDLLERFCTVIYYPLDNEDHNNNGFKLTEMPTGNGKKENFVFINTTQTIEKQVFTAAHELGHIWEIDDCVIDEVKTELDVEHTPDIRENIINRFAATLLMPETEFTTAYNYVFKKYSNADGNIRIIDMLRVIVELMNQFSTPIKSVVYRLVELQLISDKSGTLLLGLGDIPEEDIMKAVQDIIAQCGFTHFLIPNKRKWIKDLPELLGKAKKSGFISQDKINGLQKAFDLECLDNDNEIEVSIKIQEGKEH